MKMPFEVLVKSLVILGVAFITTLTIFRITVDTSIRRNIAPNFESAQPTEPAAKGAAGPSKTPFRWDKVSPKSELEWHDCYIGRQCARLLVPLNYSDPDGEKAIIALARKPSSLPTNSSEYRGPILFNPGGPGGSGVDLAIAAADSLAAVTGPQFDIVGFDPRGVGRSIPRASFFTTGAERALWGDRGLSVVNNSEQGIARTWARAQIQGQLAGETDTGYLRHINTDHTARDMLSIVRAHGREKLQYWGFSYGSILGASFASMFPDKVERLIIDGVADSENYFSTLWSNNLLDTDKTLQSFFTGCVEAGPDRCPFYAPSTEDISRNLTSLYNSVRVRPLPVRTATSYGLLDYDRLKMTIFASLYSPYQSFLPLAHGLADLAAGDGKQLYEIMDNPAFSCSCDPSEHMFDVVREAHFAILCNDGKDVPSSLEESQKYFDSLAEVSQWAENWAGIRLGCSGWPKMPKDHFQGPFVANTSHPILLIGNTADPVTPLWAAKKMSRGFKSSVVLTQDSPGHCSISAPSICTLKYIQEYFLEGTLPDPETVCSVIGSPFPESQGFSSEDQTPFQEEFSDNDRSLLEAAQLLSENFTVRFPLSVGF